MSKGKQIKGKVVSLDAIISPAQPAEEPKKGTAPKFKRARQLTLQGLKYEYPADRGLPLFDTLQEVTKTDIVEAGVREVQEVVEGIKLSSSEQKVIDSLCKMLHEKSQTLDPKKEGYYTGNAGYELEPYGDKGETTPAPRLAFTLYELTQEYKGKLSISGKDVENVKQVLVGLDTRRFLMRYIEKTFFDDKGKRKGVKSVKTIEAFKKLIDILKISEITYNRANVEVSKKEETVILLNPIFRSQIDSNFIFYPNDINRRTEIAYGSSWVSKQTYTLRNYLMNQLSFKNYKLKISQDRLYYMLAEKWMKEGRKKKVREATEKALETVKALGLLINYETITGASGEPMLVFYLNKEWG